MGWAPAYGTFLIRKHRQNRQDREGGDMVRLVPEGFTDNKGPRINSGRRSRFESISQCLKD